MPGNVLKVTFYACYFFYHINSRNTPIFVILVLLLLFPFTDKIHQETKARSGQFLRHFAVMGRMKCTVGDGRAHGRARAFPGTLATCLKAGRSPGWE